MKITLIIIQTLDGFIARGQGDDLSWGSSEDKKFFREKTREIGTMIMGSNTFRNMPEKAFSERFSVVLCQDPSKHKDYKNEFGDVVFFSGSPYEVVKFLEEKGIDEVSVIGGGNVNGQFLKANLIDEMYITISPRLFGNGIGAFGNDDLENIFRLNDVSRIGEEELLLHLVKN